MLIGYRKKLNQDHQKMHILVTGSGSFSSSYGGGQAYLRNLCLELARMGHRVTVLCNINLTPTSKWHTKVLSQVSGVTVAELVSRSRASSAVETVEIGGLSAASRELITELRPDVVHANADKSLYVRICKALGIPCVVTAHHGGIVCPTGALLHHDGTICKRAVNPIDCEGCVLRSLPGAGFGRFLVAVTPSLLRGKLESNLLKIPNIPYISQPLRSRQRVSEKISANIELGLYASCVICPSEAIRGALVRNGTPIEKTIVVPHGIPSLSARPFVVGLPRRPIRFGFVGRINREKGFHVLVDALQWVAGAFELRVIGAAHSKWEKRFLAEVLSYSKRRVSIEFCGHLIGEPLLTAMAECDVIVLPSICLEVFGLVILEAWALGRPVIVTDSGGPGEIVRDGVGGLVVPPNNPRVLASTMNRLIETPTLVGEVANTIPRVLTIREHVDQVVRIYHSVLSRKLPMRELASE